ncbi:hypothetical protein C5167_048140 [Papaver somniferum]|uniref:Uncharacterized protein n=1 Tax=Papaver somniferum TaxID=3469 RepID=A0A4Y7KJZ4_PAPSO|nr:hypothetical protein C5167_048140 [Papaver somniferum]
MGIRYRFALAKLDSKGSLPIFRNGDLRIVPVADDEIMEARKISGFVNFKSLLLNIYTRRLILIQDSNSATSPGSDSDHARASFPARAKKNLLVDLIRLSSVLCLSYLPFEVDSRQDDLYL